MVANHGGHNVRLAVLQGPVVEDHWLGLAAQLLKGEGNGGPRARVVAHELLVNGVTEVRLDAAGALLLGEQLD